VAGRRFNEARYTGVIVILATEELAVRRILALLVVVAVLAVAGSQVAAGGSSHDSAPEAAGENAEGSAQTAIGTTQTAVGGARDNERLLATPVHLTADGVLVVWPGPGANPCGCAPATSTLARLRRRADVPSVDQVFARYGRSAAYLLTVGRRSAADALIRAARRWRLDGTGGQVGVVQVATAQPAVAHRMRRLAPGLQVVSLRRASMLQLRHRSALLNGASTPPPP